MLAKLSNTLVVKGLPKSFALKNDNEFLASTLDIDPKAIQEIYLPRDNSPMKVLRGWAMIRFASEAAYLQHSARTIAGITIEKTDKLLNYALDKKLHKNLKHEELHIAEFIYARVNVTSDAAIDKDLFDSLNNFYLKTQEGGHQISQQHGLRLHYIGHSDILLAVNQDNKAKIVHRNEHGEFSLDGVAFEGFPKNVQDGVLFQLCKQEVQKLFEYQSLVSSSTPEDLKRHYINFFSSAAKTLTSSGSILYFSAPVESAKLVIDNLLHNLSKTRVKRSREFLNLSVIGLDIPQVSASVDRDHNEYLSSLDISKSFNENITVHDVNSLQNIIYKLDEQIWCRSVFKNCSHDLIRLLTSISRPNSALDRLSTFTAQPKNMHRLAELGYVSRGGLLQNVFTNSELKSTPPKWCDSIEDKIVLQSNVNIALKDSLAYLPPHKLGEKIITSKFSDYIFSFNNKGICKVYTAGLSLVHVASIDFTTSAQLK
jgi:hypothetical protein